jgi:DNA-directed RNA polymerase I, II, and III subunit RPABC2
MPSKTKKTSINETKKTAKKSEIISDDLDDSNSVDDDDEIDFDADADVDDFFNQKNFNDFGTKLKFHVFDPDTYKNEIHKEITIIPSNRRKTSEVITKFEFTDVTSNRAKQIENGGKIFADIGDEDDPIAMAELEIKQKQCPLAIRRLISSNIAEIWDVNEMIIPYIN